ncbi:hypothetical protein BH09MYX1_BH09MYX1_40890 [soil metagenome]
MTLETSLAPDVVAIARRLRARPGLAVLRSDPRGALWPSDAASSFVASDPVEVVEAIAPPNGVVVPGWAGRAAAPRWIGYVPYEAFRSLERARYVPGDRRAAPFVTTPRWHRYDAVLRIDHASGRVVIESDDTHAASALLDRVHDGSDALDDTVSVESITADDDRVHEAAIAKVLELIAAGDTYQVNLARRFHGQLRGPTLAFFERLFARAPAPYGFHFDAGTHVIAGASPELAVELRGRALRTAPIKGTRPRGVDRASDAAAALELDASEKERAELTMTIDLHRNDLGRVAVAGSVRVPAAPALRAGATVWSRVAEVRAELEPETRVEALLRAVLPCGSVTGAPKVRAMEIIAQLELDRRGLYTGAFGYVGRDGGITLAVAIRTAVVRQREVEYFAGGGIVWGSDPRRETDETRWKAHQFLRAFS